ncbi:MAG: hypothetical protein ACLFS4_06265 [Opitutales bacterium]
MELIAVLLVAHLVLTPLVALGFALRNRRRISKLEDDIPLLREQLDRATRRTQAPPRDTEAPAEEPPPPVDETRAPEQVTVPATKDPVVVRAHKQPVTESLSPEPDRPRVDQVTRARDFLRQIGMWPPESVAGRDREAILMQWWLPRIGGLLALLSALFFGVYINQSTSPLIRCLEMVAASVALTALGRYIEGRFKAFGGVLFVTGLVMLYLTSVAAYVLPAVRVIENPLVGAIAQAIVLALITSVGLLRRSAGIVLLAFHLGYFLCVFMAWEGLREGALITAGLLFAAGSILTRMSLFRHLVWVFVPGSYLTVLAFPALGLIRIVEIPGAHSVQAYLNLVTAGTIALYLFSHYKKGWQAKLLLTLATSLAILATGTFFRIFHPDTLEWACLILGCTMLAGSIAGWMKRGCGYLVQLLFIKASFLIAVWVILHYAGDLRWMILALETVIVAVSARRSGKVSMECAVWAIAVASIYYFAPVFSNDPVAGTFLWWMMALYPAVLVIAMSLLLGGFRMGPFNYKEADRRLAYALVPFTAVFLWFRFFAATVGGNLEPPAPFIAVLYAMAAVSLIPFLSRWIPLMTAALAYLVATTLFCSQPFSLFLLILLLLPAFGALYWTVRKEGRLVEWAENALYPLMLTPVVLWILQAFGDFQGKSTVVILLAVAVTAAGALPRIRHLGTWALLPPVIAWMTGEIEGDSLTFKCLSVVLGLAWLAMPRIKPAIEKGIGWSRRHTGWETAAALILWGYIATFQSAGEHWITWQFVLAVSAGILFFTSRTWPITGYFTGGLFMAGSLFYQHLISMIEGVGAYAPLASEALISSVFIFAVVGFWFFLKPSPWQPSDEAVDARMRIILSAVAAIAFFLNSVVTFQYNMLELMSWFTPILAVTAFVMILLGLFRRDAVFRRLGLAALAVPLIRLFLIDVQDSLYRIIAFAAAAVVLTLLGYLYHLLASRLIRQEDQM